MEDMKKVCLLAFVLFTWSIVVNAQESDGRYVEVTGSSEIEVVPDEIHFLVQIKEYWQEEYTGKSKKEEDFHTKVPLAMIEKDLRKSLRKIGITDDAIRMIRKSGHSEVSERDISEKMASERKGVSDR